MFDHPLSSYQTRDYQDWSSPHSPRLTRAPGVNTFFNKTHSNGYRQHLLQAVPPVPVVASVITFRPTNVQHSLLYGSQFVAITLCENKHLKQSSHRCYYPPCQSRKTAIFTPLLPLPCRTNPYHVAHDGRPGVTGRRKARHFPACVTALAKPFLSGFPFFPILTTIACVRCR